MKRTKFEIKSKFALGEEVIYQNNKTRVIGFQLVSSGNTLPIIELKTGWPIGNYRNESDELYLDDVKDETGAWCVLDKELRKVKKNES